MRSLLRIAYIVYSQRNFLDADYAENGSAFANSVGSAIVLLINRKDYEHFNKAWRESVRLWCFAFAEASWCCRRPRRGTMKKSKSWNFYAITE